MIDDLRAALAATPDNLPLRLVLAKALLDQGRAAEAEAEYRTALERVPATPELRLGLARAFAAQGKTGAALVVCEEAIASGGTSGPLLLFAARLLRDRGDTDRARRLYRSAIEGDPRLHDPGLADLAEPTPDPERVRSEDAPGLSDGSSRWDGAVERPKTTFAEVGGMQGVKDDIRLRIITPLEQPELYKAYGQKAGGGVLLYGPPGCGKTHLARATAGEIRAGFLAVGINDVLDSYIGQSERNLHEVFATARAQTPCVLFFDEVDALAASRRDLRTSAGRQTINQFLNELDGIQAGANDGLLVLAATNAPWHLDSAFLRPGRFDRIIFVPPPDETARADILRVMLVGRPVADIDHAAIAKKTKGFSGADLKAVVERSVEAKLKEALKTKRIEKVQTRDLLHAAAAIKPSTADWFATARNHAVYANEGGLYDDVLTYLGIRR